MNDNYIIRALDVQKHFHGGEIKALDGVSMDIAKGEVVVIIGPSGSGKSTFLRCLNLLEVPTGGQILFRDVDITDKNEFLTEISSSAVIINTVPADIFGDEEITAMGNGALYIELASSDAINGAVSENVKVITARGIPGKISPVTAGEIIADTIIAVLGEERGKQYE